MNEQEYLEHFGVLGMKWGRRKANVTESNGKYYDKKGRQVSSDAATKLKAKSKRINEMSNEELKKVTERINIEKNYKDAIKASSSSAGKTFVQNQLTKVGNDLASEVIKSAVVQPASKIIVSALKGAAKTIL